MSDNTLNPMESKTETVSDNKFFAEFMKMPKVSGMYEKWDAFELYTLDEFRFKTSWDWLMPVWRKCLEIGVWMMTNSHDKLWLEKSKEIEHALLYEETPAKAAKLIAHLIRWYNSQQKSQ